MSVFECAWARGCGVGVCVLAADCFTYLELMPLHDSPLCKAGLGRGSARWLEPGCVIAGDWPVHDCVSPPPSPCCKTTSSSQLPGLSVVMHSRPPPPHPTVLVSTRRGSSETSPFQRRYIVALPLPDNINSAGTSTEIEEHLKRTGETVSAEPLPESCGGSHERLWRV